MKKFILMAAILLCTVAANAQSYNWGIGLRGGLTNAELTVKKPFSVNALEATLGLSYKGSFKLSAIYEFTVPVITAGFTFYYGLGVNAGAYKNEDDNMNYKPLFGAVGVVGLEYEIPTIPFSIGIDYRPSVNIAKKPFNLGDVAFALRYCF